MNLQNLNMKLERTKRELLAEMEDSKNEKLEMSYRQHDLEYDLNTLADKYQVSVG